jgi:uncharacterized membrane protein YbhN (UPF0104 family)
LNQDVVPRKSALTRWKTVLSFILRAALLAGALVVLRRELNGVGFSDLARSLRAYGLRHLALSFVFTVLSFLTLGLLELLALSYVGRRAERIVPRRTALATAFVAHAYSQSVGLAILTGAAVRIRSYSRFGLDALDVARLSVFVTVTATLGLLATGALAFFTMPERITVIGFTLSMTPLGVLLLVPIIAYVAWGAFGRSDFHGSGNWRIRRPSMLLAAQQIGISSLDWALAGTVLFFLLPASLHSSYSAFLAVYLVAQTGAVLSHVPGGVGVFEAIVMTLLTVESNTGVGSASLVAAIGASLLLYRAGYYLLPLIGAIVLSGFAELIRARNAVEITKPGFAAPTQSLSVDAV